MCLLFVSLSLAFTSRTPSAAWAPFLKAMSIILSHLSILFGLVSVIAPYSCEEFKKVGKIDIAEDKFNKMPACLAEHLGCCKTGKQIIRYSFV
jgi:hypothetical protein